VEGLPEVATVMELAEVVQQLDDPVLQQTLGGAAGGRQRGTNIHQMLRQLLQALKPGLTADDLKQGNTIKARLQHLGELRDPLPSFPEQQGVYDVYMQFQLQTLDSREVGAAVAKLFGKLLGMQEQDAMAFLWAAKRVGATLGRSNLVLVGLAGSGSAFHRDYTEACNYLMELVVRGGKLNKAYAWWVFVRPSLAAIKAMKAWLLRHPHPGSAAAWARANAEQKAEALETLLKAAEDILEAGEQPPLGVQIMNVKEGGARLTEGMVKELDADPSMKEHIIVLKQRPGDMVRVPPGWIHCVCNGGGSSVKFAWDYYKAERLHHYAAAYDLLGRHVGLAGGDDYMALESMCMGLALQYHLRCTKGPAAAGM
jgi:hypothetical protein